MTRKAPRIFNLAGGCGMRCPFCKDNEKMSRVIDSRATEDAFVIRRRRECLNEVCSRRFTSYERVEELGLQVIKKDDERVDFESSKIHRSLEIACRKRNIEPERLDELVQKIEAEIRDTHEREVQSRFIGQLILRELRSVDHIAYARYASVYRDFKDLTELLDFMQPLRDAPDESGSPHDRGDS